MSDKINIGMQMMEAEKHRDEMRGLASKNGPGQSAAQLRFKSANAILTTLQFCRDFEPEIREYIASKRGLHIPTTNPDGEGE